MLLAKAASCDELDIFEVSGFHSASYCRDEFAVVELPAPLDAAQRLPLQSEYSGAR